MNRTGKWAKRAVWLTLAAVLSFGCSPLTSIAFLLHRNDPMPAEYPFRPKEGDKSDKAKEITVLVLTNPAGPLSFEFAGADRDLAQRIAKRMPDQAKEFKDHLAVVPPAQVDKFKMANPNWKSMHPTDWGKKLGADYVLEVTLAGMQIYQPGSNNSIYEGTAEVTVDVFDTDKGRDAALHHYIHPFTYPRGVGMARDVSEMPVSRFKQQYLEKLAYDLILMHIEHKATEGIASDQ